MADDTRGDTRRWTFAAGANLLTAVDGGIAECQRRRGTTTGVAAPTWQRATARPPCDMQLNGFTVLGCQS